MRNEPIQGLIAAPFTPMHASGEVNPGLIPAYYRMLKSNGAAGAFICGSTGESASLTMSEKKALAEAWAAATEGDADFKVISFLGGTSLRECIELAQHAQSLGLYAVSFTGPYYFKPATVQLLADCCRTVAEAVPDIWFYY